MSTTTSWTSAAHISLYRWYEVQGARHGIDRNVGMCVPETANTLCGIEFTVDPDARMGYAPTCADCDRLWREEVGIPQRVVIPPRSALSR